MKKKTNPNDFDANCLPARPVIYTLGYGPWDEGCPPELTPKEFDAIVQSINPALLVDVRGGPTRAKGMGKDQIASRFPEIHAHGREKGLGNFPQWGNIVTQAGLDWLVAQAYEKRRVVMFCACPPYECHRHYAIANKISHEVDVQHIFKGGANNSMIVVDSKELERWLKGGRVGEYHGDPWLA